MPEQSKGRERFKQLSIETAKLLGATAYSVLFFAPHAAQHTLETTSATVQVADFPAELSFNPDGSQLNVLNQATVYTDQQRWGVGLKADITGLPRFGSSQELISYFTPERFSVYASLAETPEQAVAGYRDILSDEALRNFLAYERIAAIGGGVAIYGSLRAAAYRRRVRELEGKGTGAGMVTPLYLGGIAVMALAGSATVAQYDHHQWQQSSPRPDHLTVISALDDTSLEGTATDNAWALNVLNQGITYADTLKERRRLQRDAYLQTVGPQLTEGILDLPDLRDSEELIFVMTDMHSGQAGISLSHQTVSTLQERYGIDAVRAVLNLGDMSYGAEFQRQSVLDQSFEDEGVPTLVVRGNHDVGQVPRWIENGEMQELKGEYEVGGISFYGQPDPQQTPLFGTSSYPDPDFTNTDLGEKIRETLEDEPADILGIHQPAALGAFANLPSISDYMLSEEDTDLTTCDFGEGSVESLPTTLVSAGHWHDQYQLKLICAEDGTWSVINLQGSGGGANESPTINNWSDPDGKPIKPISFRVFIRNAEHDSITGYINIEISPDGSVSPIERVDIGTTTGAPFTTTDDNPKSDGGKSAVKQQEPSDTQ